MVQAYQLLTNDVHSGTIEHRQQKHSIFHTPHLRENILLLFTPIHVLKDFFKTVSPDVNVMV